MNETKLVLDKGHPLYQYLLAFDWTEVLEFGTIMIQIRDGIPTLLRIEITVKMD